MIFVFKYFCSWFQCQGVIVKCEQYWQCPAEAKNKGVHLNVRLHSINDLKGKYNKMKSLYAMNDFGIQTSSQLISIPDCDSKS